MIASNYRNLAETYFDKAKYETAGKYYDSTLTVLKPRTREHYAIKKKRDNLDDVIFYEGIARVNDSILNIAGMTDPGKIFYFETYIAQLKKEDEARAKKEKEEAKLATVQKQSLQGKENNIESLATATRFNPNAVSIPDFSDVVATPSITADNKFDFYNPSTLAFGKREFIRVWGNRPYKENWRWLSDVSNLSETEEDDSEDNNVAKSKEKIEDPRYNIDFYISQLPTEPKILDSLAKERNFAYYQLGLIYKEKFKEYHLAIPKLETLLQMDPEERLVLPSMYNLYKIYQIIGSPKEAQMRDQILRDFPESRYAQIISQTEAGILTAENDPEVVFANLYKMYSQNQLRESLIASNEAIDLLTGEEIIPKIELLKATLIGKLEGLEAYKNALNFVALTYPNSTEGKEAELLLRTQIPTLEGLDFNESTPISWKIIYRTNNLEDKKIQELLDKLIQFSKERTIDKLSISVDIYTQKENFIVIHGIKSEQHANNIVSILRDYKEYQIKEKTIIISNDNYKVIQIKKNLEAYEASLKP
jgi:tetratricopeptide (TPR) repeat protein